MNHPESSVSDHISKIRPNAAATSHLITNNHNTKSTIINGRAYFQTRHHYNHGQLNEINQPNFDRTKSVSVYNKSMEFLIPQVPNTAVTRPTTLGGSDLTLNNIESHFNNNFHIIQSRTKSSGTIAVQPKMTKKQLKLAQAQLDKLTQINIHLQGTFD